MEYRDDVLFRLKAMGDYFGGLVSDPKTKFTSKTKAANLSLRCYSELLKAECNKKEIVDAITFFMTGITEKILRSELYSQYLQFCIMKDVEPESRNLFYDKVRKLQFNDRRESNGTFFLPPD